jgi:hypothetical protein
VACLATTSAVSLRRVTTLFASSTALVTRPGSERAFDVNLLRAALRPSRAERPPKASGSSRSTPDTLRKPPEAHLEGSNTVLVACRGSQWVSEQSGGASGSAPPLSCTSRRASRSFFPMGGQPLVASGGVPRVSRNHW